jgi:cytochrome b561
MKFNTEKFTQIMEPMKHKGAQATSHHWSTKWVHWVAAALLAFGAIANGDVTGALFSHSAMMTETLVGVAIAVLYTFLWFSVRRKGDGSRLPSNAPKWERLLAKVVHLSIYGSIAAVLLSGFAMAYLAPTDIIVNAPAHEILQMSNRFSFVRDFHEFVSGVLGWAFGLHFVGALWHRVVRRDGVMQSISIVKRKAV